MEVNNPNYSDGKIKKHKDTNMADLTQAQKDALFAEWNEQAEQAERRKQELLNLSDFRYGGTLLAVELSTPQPKIDRTTKEVVMVNGQPSFWESIYFCELAHLGSSRKFVVPLELGKDLVQGNSYLFTGTLVDEQNKLKVKLITKI